MAIYSCNLTSIGRTTHAAGTAGAHVGYIARPEASPALLCDHMPEDPAAARTFLDRAERADRVNARVIDKIRIALPRELDEEQRAALVREFMADLTRGRVPWFAAIHQSGEDAHNPHAHIAVRDRDIETGKRVLRLSDSPRDRQSAGLEPKAVDWVRERWEHHANRALEAAGQEARIDRRSLEARGIEREPTIHIGPRAQHIESHVGRPESKVRIDGRGRAIDYPMIDAGRTRLERHAEIVDLNLERAARSPHLETRVWAQFERDQRQKDRLLSARLTADRRRRTLEERRIRQTFRGEEREARQLRQAEAKAVREMVRTRYAPIVSQLKERQGQEREALRTQQGSLWQRFLSIVDVSGATRRKRDAMRAELGTRHKAERQALTAAIRETRMVQRDAVAARYAPVLDDLRTRRAIALRDRADRDVAAEAAAEQERQARERDREQAANAVSRQIAAWKAAQLRTQSRARDQGLER